MFFDNFSGNIQITTELERYLEGDCVRGTITLNMKRNQNARCLRIRLIETVSLGDGSVDRILSEKILSSKSFYSVGSSTYDFEFVLPIMKRYEFHGNSIPSNFLAKFLNFLQTSPNKLSLNVSLDIPLSFDVNKTLKLKVSPNPDKAIRIHPI